MRPGNSLHHRFVATGVPEASGTRPSVRPVNDLKGLYRTATRSSIAKPPCNAVCIRIPHADEYRNNDSVGSARPVGSRIFPQAPSSLAARPEGIGWCLSPLSAVGSQPAPPRNRQARSAYHREPQLADSCQRRNPLLRCPLCSPRRGMPTLKSPTAGVRMLDTPNDVWYATVSSCHCYPDRSLRRVIRVPSQPQPEEDE